MKKAYRGQGIGKQLLQAILEEIKTEGKVPSVKLWVEDSQSAAYALYKKAGFKAMGKEKTHLAVMELTLT